MARGWDASCRAALDRDLLSLFDYSHHRPLAQAVVDEFISRLTSENFWP